jgi:hypothetical protein
MSHEFVNYLHPDPVYPWSSAANATQPLRRLERMKAQARIPSELCFYLEQAEQAKT